MGPRRHESLEWMPLRPSRDLVVRHSGQVLPQGDSVVRSCLFGCRLRGQVARGLDDPSLEILEALEYLRHFINVVPSEFVHHGRIEEEVTDVGWHESGRCG